MRRYQIIMKPLATASGERGHWSFVAHGATYSAEEARKTCERIDARGDWKTRKLPI